MFCLNSKPISTYESLTFVSGYIFFFIICAVSCTPVVKYLKKKLITLGKASAVMNTAYRLCDIASPAILIILSSITLVGDSYNPFLYFQF